MRHGKEQSHWKDVTADMMSDEERVGDIYVRHLPFLSLREISQVPDEVG